jgi:alpha-beta hydrolase superfamily lysophospholipase
VSSRPELEPAVRRETPFVSQGQTCAAWLFEPSGASTATTVVMAHGATLTRADGLERFARPLAEAGAHVLAFDHRNLGDSGGKPRSRIRIDAQRRDWQAAVRHVRALTPDARVVVWGFSLAALHAASIAAGDDAIAAALLLCPAVGVGRRLRGLSAGQLAWVLPRVVGDLAGRATLVPVTGPPGSRALMTLPGEAAGFASVVAAGSRWRNEISPGALGQALRTRLPRMLERIACPVWIGIGDRDDTVDPAGVVRAAARQQHITLERLAHDHFSVFAADSDVPARQVAFLSRAGALG